LDTSIERALLNENVTQQNRVNCLYFSKKIRRSHFKVPNTNITLPKNAEHTEIANASIQSVFGVSMRMKIKEYVWNNAQVLIQYNLEQDLAEIMYKVMIHKHVDTKIDSVFHENVETINYDETSNEMINGNNEHFMDIIDGEQSNRVRVESDKKINRLKKKLDTFVERALLKENVSKQMMEHCLLFSKETQKSDSFQVPNTNITLFKDATPTDIANASIQYVFGVSMRMKIKHDVWKNAEPLIKSSLKQDGAERIYKETIYKHVDMKLNTAFDANR